MKGLVCRVRVEVAGESARSTTLLEERQVEPHSTWDLYQADLARWGGEEVQLTLGVDCSSAEGRRSWSDAARWSVPLVYGRRPREPNVLLLTVDTLRADHLGAYGYPQETSPHIDGLARRGLLFLRAETPQSATWPALTSLHTSQYPSAHGVIWNGHEMPPGIVTLAGLLQGRRYSTSAFLANMQGARHPGFDRLTRARAGEQSLNDLELTEAAIAELELLRNRPFFLWLHLIGPHASYAPPAPWDTAFTRPGRSAVGGTLDGLVRIRQEGRPLSEADVAHVVGLYDGEIGRVDELMGRVLHALGEFGLEETTLVIFTADHGEDLHEHHRYFFHSPSMYGSSLHVPLVLALPGVLRQGAATEQPASLLDIPPTVLGLLGLPVPSTFQGRDLLPGGRPPDEPVQQALFSETNGRIYGVRTDAWRLIVNPEGTPPGAPGGAYPIERVELYDLGRDPHEQRNVATEQPEAVEALTAEIEAWKERSLRKELPSQTVDPETLEELRALGYVFE